MLPAIHHATTAPDMEIECAAHRKMHFNRDGAIPIAIKTSEKRIYITQVARRGCWRFAACPQKQKSTMFLRRRMGFLPSEPAQMQIRISFGFPQPAALHTIGSP